MRWWKTYAVLFFLGSLSQVSFAQEQEQQKQDTARTCLLEVNNVFTPDGDGVNESWELRGIEEYKTNTVELFNRWGEQVGNFEHYDNKEVVWRGQDMEGKALPGGTYFYIIKLSDTTCAASTGYVQILK